MTIFKKVCSTTTTLESRLRIAQPTRRPILLEQVNTNSYGTVRVKGKLGQQHLDVLSAIRYSGKPVRMDDGRIKLLCDPAEVRRISNQTSGSTFKNIRDDLMAFIVEIIEPKPLACIGHLVDHIGNATKSDGSLILARNPFGGERHLWRVELGKAACMLLDTDFRLDYDPGPIARLEHGITQAIARHLMTHKNEPNGGWIIDNLIKMVAGDISAQAMRDRRRELRSEECALKIIGYLVVGDRLKRGAKA